jgi:hypothetical protein
LNFLDRFSRKSSNINVHKNPSSGSQVVSCGRTDGQTETHTEEQTHRLTDREGDMIQVTVALGNFVNSPKNVQMQLIYKNTKYTDALDDDLTVYFLIVENTKG